jgi:Flp pilus assembly protein TadD
LANFRFADYQYITPLVDSFRFHASLGEALFAREKLDEAILGFQMALRLRPNDGVTHENLGSAFHRRGPR